MSGAVRVSTRFGKKPVIIVAPHGPDDVKTDIIANHLADALDSYAVINNGFDRADDVDVTNDEANCNKVNHIKQDVVYDEFLKPIINFKNQIKKNLHGSFGITSFGRGGWGWSLPSSNDKKTLIFYIHGAGDHVHRQVGENIGCIVGYGLGKKEDSLTCEYWRKNLFVDLWRNYASITDGEIYEGRGGGNYAGRSTQNLNQYFRKHELDPWVDCMQLEIPYSMRKTESRAALTAILLSTVINDMIDVDSYELDPNPKFI